MSELAPLPAGPFQLIYADPAWNFKTYNGEKSVPTQGADPYATLTTAQMRELPVADCAAKNSLLVMWTIGSHLDQAIDLGTAWGFSYTTDLFIWLKERRHLDESDKLILREDSLRVSMGYHTRKQAESCLLFKRGKGLPVLDHAVRQCIFAPPGAHSRKPDEAYDRLHRLYGDVERIELFARTTRPGWSVWGNETEKYG